MILLIENFCCKSCYISFVWKDGQFVCLNRSVIQNTGGSFITTNNMKFLTNICQTCLAGIDHTYLHKKHCTLLLYIPILDYRYSAPVNVENPFPQNCYSSCGYRAIIEAMTCKTFVMYELYNLCTYQRLLWIVCKS